MPHVDINVKLCDLEINPVTLKLESVLDMLKMYPHTEDEAAGLKIQYSWFLGC